MSISVAAPVNQSARVRALKQQHPYMSPEDIAATTGLRLANVRAALRKGEQRKKPKSKLIEARGPLTAEYVAERLQIPVEAARRVTG
jgi:hypothetical protein